MLCESVRVRVPLPALADILYNSRMTGNLYGLVKAAGFAKTLLHGYAHNEAHKMLSGEEEEAFPGQGRSNIDDIWKIIRSKKLGLGARHPGLGAARQDYGEADTGASPQFDDLQMPEPPPAPRHPAFIPGDFGGGMQARMINGTPVYVPNNIAAILNRRAAQRQFDNYPGYM